MEVTSSQRDVQAVKLTIKYDAVKWLMAALRRYEVSISSTPPHPGKGREAAKLSALLEVMQALNLKFADADAALAALGEFPEFAELQKLKASA